MRTDPSLIRGILDGDRRVLSRAISLVENELSGSRELLHQIYSHTGHAYRIGITGPPGAGKSTIANKLAQHYRSIGKKIGIIAVDPTSPFTGGALLGDRIRMSEIELDGGIFIRSMATRGSLGGLSRKAVETADLLDAAGFDIIMIETVGVGQSELDIAGAADTTLVVLVPESGDAIQAMKAGLMEIGDCFILNKADRPGADQAIQSLQTILGFRKPSGGWHPAILQTVAVTAAGIPEAAAAIERHRDSLLASNELGTKLKERIRRRVRDLVDQRFSSSYWTPEKTAELETLIDTIVLRTMSPYDAADTLFQP